MPHHKLKHVVGHEMALVEEDPIQQYTAAMENHDPNVTFCCVPLGCNMETVGRLAIHTNDLSDTIRVLCNNENCQEGSFMHRLCFEQWEESVLTYLRSTGRARSWSEKQRLQNLWTKKGYDLAYKACGCKCGKGHLKKDLDWIAPPAKVALASASTNLDQKKRNRKKRINYKPSLTLTGACHSTKPSSPPNLVSLMPVARMRSSSMSSTGSGSGAGSPPSSGPEYPTSPTHQPQEHPPAPKQQFFSDRRERHGSGSIFSRRTDYSSFNTLPRHKINSYHIKMEDEGSHGNDDTRCFILSSLALVKTNRISCVLCHGTMLIFDRYPLVDGTFFLSPRQHSKGCVPVRLDGRPQYLNAVCMGCLEGWTSAGMKCRYCQARWNGSHLILGSMYSYDIFAATPCCPERLRCNNCHKMVMPADRRLQFFSDYSHSVACPHCRVIDFHFVKSLSTYNRRESE